MRDIVQSFRNNPIKWTIAFILELILCWEVARAVRTIVPWYFILPAFILGICGGVVIVVKIFEPLSNKRTKVTSWFRNKNPYAP